MIATGAGDAAERASAAWKPIASRCLVRAGGGQLLAKDGPKRGAPTSALWPLSQVLGAAASLLPLGLIDVGDIITPMLRGLERYRSGHGYGPFPNDNTRYYDDNAWVALDLLQLAAITGDLHHLDEAVALFGFLAEGEAPTGGIYWVEGERSRNTCSTGPTAQVAVRLFEATSEEEYLDFTLRQMAFLDRELRDERGLYRDNVGGDGSVERTIWSYNQGTPIGAAVQLAHITGEEQWLDRAIETASATVDHFGHDDGWWRQPPVFNAVFFRNLLVLLASRPDPRLLGVLDDYLDRVWTRARHWRTGLFVENGIGSYDGRPTIDQAGLTQVFAFRAWPPDRWSSIC
jgi:hypothetical protein